MNGATPRRSSLVRSYSVRLFSLFLVFSLVQGGAFFLVWHYFSDQQKQRAEWSVAIQLRERLGLLSSHPIDFDALRRAADQVLDEDLERNIHIVNEKGEVLASFCRSCQGPPLRSIALEPIAVFLRSSGRENAPLYGSDPYSEDNGVLFSVAEITVESAPGYLYVVLNNEHARRIASRYISQSSILEALLGSAVAGLVTLITGAALFTPLSRRISGLMSVVRSLRDGNRQARVPQTGTDELAELGATFNQMAGEIESLVLSLERKDEMRRELVENIWHDIRGPVAGLRGLAELLQRQGDGGPELDAGQLVTGIMANAVQLTRFLDELRDVSDLELAERKPANEAVDMVDLADEICASLSQDAGNRGIALKVIADSPIPLVRGDATLLARMLRNLLENALRYSQPGTDVRVEMEDQQTHVLVSVVDNGVGISEADLPRLFEREFRGEVRPGTSAGSRGLGLAIVKAISEAHGSAVTVQSTVGGGTRFSFVLKRFADG